ncbi:MAG: hypothetical protein ACTSXG_04045, partial [Alphaproteobacteria bacterium]
MWNNEIEREGLEKLLSQLPDDLHIILDEEKLENGMKRLHTFKNSLKSKNANRFGTTFYKLYIGTGCDLKNIDDEIYRRDIRELVALYKQNGNVH